MLVRVNKKGSAKPVKYAALSTGTISHVWYDDDAELGMAKRQNRIRMIRAADQSKPHYDA